VKIWADLGDLRERAARLGCLGTGARSACTWSPSEFTVPMFTYFGKVRDDAREQCIARYGEGLLSESALEQRFFFDPSELFANDANKLQQARALRNSFLAKAYLARPDTFEQLPADAEAYARRVYQLLGIDEDELAEGLRGSTEFTHTMGKPGLFGVVFGWEGTTGLRGPEGGELVPLSDPPGSDPLPGAPDACRDGPFAEGHLFSRIEILGASIDVLALDERASRRSEPGADERSEWGLALDVDAKGELLAAAPCEADGEAAQCNGYAVEVGASIGYGGVFGQAGATFQAGPVTIALRAGVSGAFGAKLGFHAKEEWVNRIPTAGSGPRPSCPQTYRSEIDFTFGPYAGLQGFISAGAGLGPLQVGIKGALTIIQLELPTTYRESYDSSTSVRKTEWLNDLVLTLLSGRISVFVNLDVVVTAITLIEFTLFEWVGPTFRTRLYGEEDFQNVCWIGAVRALAYDVPQVEGCVCGADWCSP
jgi:hypothetical protein